MQWRSVREPPRLILGNAHEVVRDCLDGKARAGWLECGGRVVLCLCLEYRLNCRHGIIAKTDEIFDDADPRISLSGPCAIFSERMKPDAVGHGLYIDDNALSSKSTTSSETV